MNAEPAQSAPPIDVASGRVRLIVFDLDGTLIDSRRDLANATNALLVECGADPLAEERVGRMVGDGAATLVSRAFAASGFPPPNDALDRFLRIYGDHLLDHTRPYPGICEALESLRALRRLAVLTNKPLASTRRILHALALDRYFPDDAVIGGDGPFPRKPDPAGLRHLAECAHVPLTDTLLVGDSAIDWRTARAAPSPVCLVRYGFGFEGIPVDELSVDARIIDAPNELMSL